MATIQIAPRPAPLDGCFATWSETEAPNTIRSDMEMAGFTKVRRRATYSTLQVDASVTLPAALYQSFRDWYGVACASGTVPTRVKRPQDNLEMVMRFAAPPTYEWPPMEPTAFTVSVKLEQLPQWRSL
jgi:hypothetical protein